ncbi:hypothetical protein QZR14_00180 [Pseudomonas sp. rhizo66]|nr:hypothetical protein [Pseudomonas sp. rhizo66]MDT3309760.1 hypothetical protein [Pseudomonas sp. rhizo66]
MIQSSSVKSPLSLAGLLAINTLPAIAAERTATECESGHAQ